MTAEQIALRQEVRQLLNEAGINKNTLKDIVREVIDEELTKAVRQVMHEMDLEDKIRKATGGNLQDAIRKELRASIDNKVNGIFNRMLVSVSIINREGDDITK